MGIADKKLIDKVSKVLEKEAGSVEEVEVFEKKSGEFLDKSVDIIDRGEDLRLQGADIMDQTGGLFDEISDLLEKLDLILDKEALQLEWQDKLLDLWRAAGDKLLGSTDASARRVETARRGLAPERERTRLRIELLKERINSEEA